jgi:predicted nuclease of predicted toxin-antitoxin system
VKFKLDENMPAEAAALLRGAGHDVRSASDQNLGGGPDAHLIRACIREERALLTLDLGFANILAYPPAEHPGIIVLRLSRQALPAVLGALRGVVALLEREDLAGHLWIVDETRIRIR